jgi:hypothetical protein
VNDRLEQLLADVMLELGLVAARIGDLVDVVSGEALAIPRVFQLTALVPFRRWEAGQGGGGFHSIYLRFDGTQPSAGGADEIVPPRTGRILTRPYSMVSVGADATSLGVAPAYVYATMYARQLPPATYSLGTMFVQSSPRAYTPRGGELILADNTAKTLDPTKYPGANYVLLRVDPLAAAGDGIWITDNGSDPTNAASARIPLVAGEEIEISEAALANIRVTRLAATNVNVYVQGRSYP